MGGKLFNSQRLDTASYEKIRDEVMDKLKGRIAEIPPAFKTKDSWGDLDVILTYPFLDKEWIKKEFEITDDCISQNSSVISISWKQFQIDFIHMEPENFQSALDYYGRGDAGNLIGRLFHQLGFKFGHIGLYYPVCLKAEDCLGEIIVSKNIEQILKFINLDYNEWKAGFEDKLHLYNWISKSSFFSKSIFKLENQNHLNRKRNAVRPVYQDFLKWLDDKEFNDYIPLENKTNYLWQVAMFFGFEWMYQAAELIASRAKIMSARDVFNGNDVKELLSIHGKQLGDVMKSYKKYVEETERILSNADNIWIDFLNESTKEEVVAHFINWYEGRMMCRSDSLSG